MLDLTVVETLVLFHIREKQDQKITQSALALAVQTTRECVNRVLRTLRDAGFIHASKESVSRYALSALGETLMGRMSRSKFEGLVSVAEQDSVEHRNKIRERSKTRGPQKRKKRQTGLENPVIAKYIETFNSTRDRKNGFWIDYGFPAVVEQTTPIFRRHIRTTLEKDMTQEDWFLVIDWAFLNWRVLRAEHIKFPRYPSLRIIYGWRESWLVEARRDQNKNVALSRKKANEGEARVSSQRL